MHYTTQVPKLLSRQFDDEVILANFETGLYYSLTGTAAQIWLALDAGLAVNSIADAFAKGNMKDVDGIKQSVASFVDALLAEQVIAPYLGPANPKPWSPDFTEKFSSPVFERFDDLRDLLFLDPVHDVSETGWPVRETDDN